jgi:2-phosphosulfolactate phosphatase
MHVDVAPVLEEAASHHLADTAVLVIDVLRATTTMITAIAHGCAAIVPVIDAPAARVVRARLGNGALLAGEHEGDRIHGFDLGNSPLECLPDRVRDRAVVLITTNGTRALLAVQSAARVAVAALVNLTAAAHWTVAERRDVMIVCSGDRGEVALEDTVCAGLLAGRLVRTPDVTLSARAKRAMQRAAPYADDLRALRAACPWAQTLIARGRAADVDACLAMDTFDVVPVYAAAEGFVTR